MEDDYYTLYVMFIVGLVLFKYTGGITIEVRKA